MPKLEKSSDAKKSKIARASISRERPRAPVIMKLRELQWALLPGKSVILSRNAKSSGTGIRETSQNLNRPKNYASALKSKNKVHRFHQK